MSQRLLGMASRLAWSLIGALVLGLTVVGCASQPASVAINHDAASNAPSSSVAVGGATRRTAVVGQSADLLTHCNFKFAVFDGHTWLADHPPTVPMPKPDAHGNVAYTGYTEGVLTEMRAGELRFTADASRYEGHTVVVFRPTTTAPPLCA
jgi:hypothetical protein